MSGAATVEAEDEFIEVGLEVLAAQPVVNAQGPDLEVGEDPVNPRQDDMGGHLADDMGIVGDAGGAGVSGPTIRLGGGAGGDVVGEEGVEAGSRVISDLAEADAAGAKAAVFDLDSAGTGKRSVPARDCAGPATPGRAYPSACRASAARAGDRHAQAH